LLLVRLSAFGDVIHALPLAENAHRAGASVGWLVERRYRDLLEGNPHVGEIFVADTRLWRRDPTGSETLGGLRNLIRALRRFAPKATIDVQGLWKSAVVARLAGAPVLGFTASDRREGLSAILCARRVQPSSEIPHIVDRNLALLSAAGIPIVRRAPDASYLLSRPSAEAADFLARQPRPFALYHPGAGKPEKIWPAEKLAAVARTLAGDPGLAPAISWGPGDEPLAARMASELPGARLLPPLDPLGLAHVVAAASIFIAGDTGPLHLADALGARTLALFGPTDPDRNGPYRGTAVRIDSATSPDAVAVRARRILQSPAPAPSPERDPGPRRVGERSAAPL